MTAGKGIAHTGVVFSAKLTITGLWSHLIQTLWIRVPQKYNDSPKAIIHQILCFWMKMGLKIGLLRIAHVIELYMTVFLHDFHKKVYITIRNNDVIWLTLTFQSNVADFQKNIWHHERWSLKKIQIKRPKMPNDFQRLMNSYCWINHHFCLILTWILFPYLIFFRKSTSGSSLGAIEVASGATGTPSSFLFLQYFYISMSTSNAEQIFFFHKTH